MKQKKIMKFNIFISGIIAIYLIKWGNDLQESVDGLQESLEELQEAVEELTKFVYLHYGQISNKETSSQSETKEKTIDEFINEIGNDAYDKLINLHTKLLPIINTNDNIEIIQIGDFVNLTDEEVPIYSDIYMQEALHSYYGTSEIRLVQEIVMEKEGIIANINNMDDYEILIDLGYQVTGYTLANQYSLDEQGNITPEFRCEKDSVKQIIRITQR